MPDHRIEESLLGLTRGYQEPVFEQELVFSCGSMCVWNRFGCSLYLTVQCRTCISCSTSMDVFAGLRTIVKAWQCCSVRCLAQVWLKLSWSECLRYRNATPAQARRSAPKVALGSQTHLQLVVCRTSAAEMNALPRRQGCSFFLVVLFWFARALMPRISFPSLGNIRKAGTSMTPCHVT